MKILLLKYLLALSVLMSSCIVFGEEMVATLRESTPLTAQNENPHKLLNPENKDERRSRAYPMQPPTIPHKISNYQVDLKANKCLSCHARTRTSESNAPMVSVTHFMDRDGNFLADVSPRRYFCTQCHVTQVDIKPMVTNTFIDMHSMNKKTKNSHSK